MFKRILTGVTLIGTVIGTILLAYFVSNIFLDVYILIWSALAVYEMWKCFSDKGYHIHRLPLIFVLIANYPVYYCLQRFYGIGLQGTICVFLLAVALQLAMFTFGKKEDNTLKNLTTNMFIMVYPVMFLTMAFVLEMKYGGIYAILFAIFMPIGADTLAYFVGSTMGKRKLCPNISPKKTIAGAVGGLLGSMIVAVVFFLIFDYFGLLAKCGYTPFIAHTVQGWEWKSSLIYLAIGLVGGVVAEIGDLTASRIKRELEIKDYGNIFPGHGGVMDRLDSIMSGVLVLLVAFSIIYGF